jgi:hypothetical protein
MNSMVMRGALEQVEAGVVVRFELLSNENRARIRLRQWHWDWKWNDGRGN